MPPLLVLFPFFFNGLDYKEISLNFGGWIEKKKETNVDRIVVPFRNLWKAKITI